MISVAICSHDRSSDVAICLAGLAPQRAGEGVELLLIDSCSTAPHARELAALAVQYKARLVRLERAGHSFARNAALSLANGSWVAYLDDDAVPQPDWLRCLRRSIDTGGDDLAAIGGMTEPQWPNGLTPNHISPRWLFYLSCIESPLRQSAKRGAKVCGANLAFRRDRLISIGGFRNELGRIGDRLIGGEETLAVKQLLRQGFDAMYEPSVRVKHRIPEERLSLDWIRRRAYWEGVTEVAQVNAANEPFPRNLALPKLALSKQVFRALYGATGNPDFLIRSQVAAGALEARTNPPKANAPSPGSVHAAAS